MDCPAREQVVLLNHACYVLTLRPAQHPYNQDEKQSYGDHDPSHVQGLDMTSKYDLHVEQLGRCCWVGAVSSSNHIDGTASIAASTTMQLAYLMCGLSSPSIVHPPRQ